LIGIHCIVYKISTERLRLLKLIDVKNRNVLGIITGVAAFIVAYVAVQSVFFDTKPDFEGQMVEIADELNRACPIMVDNETRLDSASTQSNKTFQYHYTLINMEKDSVDITELEDYLEPIILHNLRTSSDLKVFRNNNVTMTYQYQDMNEAFLFELVFLPEQYKQ